MIATAIRHPLLTLLLTLGLAVERDILGHPIVGLPDLGAIELP